MIGKNVEEILEAAEQEAKKYRHEYICAEHLLYCLLADRQVREVLQICNCDINRLRGRLEKFFTSTLEAIAEGKAFEPQQTIGFQRILQRTILHVKYSGGDTVTPTDILASIFTESESFAVYFLSQEGVTRLDVLEAISHGIDNDSAAVHDPLEAPEQPAASSPLDSFTTCLTEKSVANSFDPLVGREKEIDRLIHVLCRRQKHNPLLVGDQGVGKTAIVYGLAHRIANDQVPEPLANCEVYLLDVGDLLAGTKYRGDFEKRLKSVLAALKSRVHPILVIDEIHTIVGAGATSGGSLDFANLLKPALTDGGLRCIGITSFDEYKKHFSKDPALSRRFLKIDISEPSSNEAVKILNGLKPRYEEFHNVQYSPEAIKAAVQLSAKYIHERFLPDKAIDLIDEAGCTLKLKTNNPDVVPEVTAEDIEELLAKTARVPKETISTSDKDKLGSLESELKGVVFGQDEAIGSVVRCIKRARAGLASPHKPIGSFLFAGPTGVGKTELARQLSSQLGLELLRFDMSEYMEKHSVARFLGAPPGYVGHEEGGALIDAVIRNPHSVLLLDEIEKAHPDIFNMLLQVMDEASLTDASGRKADFQSVILVMTSNVGSENMYGMPMGFQNTNTAIGQGAIEKMFRPEFLNRLDLIVKFNALPKLVIEQVVDKFIAELDGQLLARDCSVVVSPRAREFLAEEGYSQKFGAREMSRVFQRELKDPLSDALLFGELSGGGLVHVDLDKSGRITFGFSKKSKRAKKAPQAVEAE